jgi:hypothetical protein
MRDTTKGFDEAAAIAEACERLRWLTEEEQEKRKRPVHSWAIIHWDDPSAADPRDLYEAALGLAPELLAWAVDRPLDAHELALARKIIPVLRRGPPKKQKGQRGPRSRLLRDRHIAAVVAIICQHHRLKPYRNDTHRHLASEKTSGCLIIAKAAKLSERTVEEIYRKYGQH